MESPTRLTELAIDAFVSIARRRSRHDADVDRVGKELLHMGQSFSTMIRAFVNGSNQI